MKKLLEIFKNICFPKTCMCCENFVEEGGLCENCWEKIKWISEPTCKICGIPLEMDTDFCIDCLENKNHFDKAISVFLYDSISKNIILNFKEKDATYLAPNLAQWINRAIQNISSEIDVIIPVPTNFLQRILRRYNQTELLCRELSEISKIDYEPRVLRKNGNSKIQKMLSRKRRLKNLKNVFSINEKYVGAIRDKVVLLVDDVITTGATANECANVLKSAGAAKVYVATLARVKLQRK